METVSEYRGPNPNRCRFFQNLGFSPYQVMQDGIDAAGFEVSGTVHAPDRQIIWIRQDRTKLKWKYPSEYEDYLVASRADYDAEAGYLNALRTAKTPQVVIPTSKSFRLSVIAIALAVAALGGTVSQYLILIANGTIVL